MTNMLIFGASGDMFVYFEQKCLPLFLKAFRYLSEIHNLCPLGVDPADVTGPKLEKKQQL